ncbi:hypothetical protein PAV_1c07120 [Paenibacillus alvei DSM 29]|nr:hypothetical protein PAV_1c07120 [Paenibacillus alvei DSM 29]
MVGIGIILFSILFKLCTSGMDLVALIFGFIGLLIVIFGGVSKSGKS